MSTSAMVLYVVGQAQDLQARGFTALEVIAALEVAKHTLMVSSVRLVPRSPILPAGGPLPPVPGEGN